MRSKWEIRAQKELESLGYSVDYKIRPTRPNPHYNTDYFNLFDLLAYKPNELRFISVKSAPNASRTHQSAIGAFKAPFGVSKELWRYDRDPSNKRTIRRRIWVFDEKGRKELNV